MFDAANHIDLAPHCSLSTRGAFLFFGSVCLPTFGVAVTPPGLWPVPPFAGAEMLLLGWALHANMQRRFERETIDVSETQVTWIYPRQPSVVFPRHWARVKIRRPKSPLHRGHLVLESHGRAYEVGKFLSEEERHQLAAQLKQLIGGMNQSPALPHSGSPE